MRGKCVVVLLIMVSLILVGCQEQEESQNIDDQTAPEISKEEIDENNNEVEGVEAEEKKENTDNEEIVEEDPVSEEMVERYQINEATWEVEPLENGNEKVVLLTIDDAPKEYAVEMAETLKRLNVGAIFFVNGHFLNEEGKQSLKKIHDMGFEIGNHTMSHPNMTQLTEEEQRAEIIELNEIIYDVIGELPRFYRAPFGANTEFTNNLMNELNMTKMNWTYGYDWEADYMNADSLADIMVNTPLLKNGANLLMHDREWTAAALENIVTGLQEKGYEIVNPTAIKTE
ncbi:polysaccharide deacetylase family protein [Bacillus suaedae]|uniref:Polysaccharide deacetylase family protein n=1 Tax=Halalkalibacter suaedae TaxID=2822140 RepID=A0A941ATM1_9BACI|nr:polysaccharide deacetylase family protein [Bacillus suaedae]MBP3952184.1 polysaccharide deacetylase family protein [Bacillus suaedae]